MKQHNIAIRADGSAQIGMGHLMRCLSIALALREYRVKVIFITNNQQSQAFFIEKDFECELLPGALEDGKVYNSMEEEVEDTLAILKEKEIDLLLVDSYAATEQYLEKLNAILPVYYLDDLGRMDLPVSGFINYNIYGQDMGYEQFYPKETKLLLGSSYAPVKTAFKETAYQLREKVSNILITMGGSDALNIAGQLGELLVSEIPEEISLTLVCGRFSPHFAKVQEWAAGYPERVWVLTDVTDMWNVMASCDLAIAAAGSTMYELCTMGVPTICCYYVENQRRIAECFGEKTSMLNAGDFSEKPEQVLQSIGAEVQRLIQSVSLRRNLAQEMQQIADGLGAYRIAQKLIETK